MDAAKQAVELLSERVRDVAAVVGSLYLLKVAVSELWSLAGGFQAYFLAPWGISRTNLRKYGQWAALITFSIGTHATLKKVDAVELVTGASEGIGRGYAMELARHGMDVVIISNSEERLQNVASEIKEKYGCEVRVITVDFCDGQDIYPQIAEELKDLDIGILVNNVGLSYELPDFVANVSEMRFRSIIELNCQSLVQMTRLVLPKMVEQKRGAIINISSAAAVKPTQLVTVYSASKAFVNYFSDALRKEYEPKGIYVQNVLPFFVSTAMIGFRKVSFLVPNGESYARAAVATIGVQKNTYGCWSHAIQGYIAERLPEWLFSRLAWRSQLANRARRLKQLAKKQ